MNSFSLHLSIFFLSSSLHIPPFCHLFSLLGEIVYGRERACERASMCALLCGVNLLADISDLAPRTSEQAWKSDTSKSIKVYVLLDFEKMCVQNRLPVMSPRSLSWSLSRPSDHLDRRLPLGTDAGSGEAEVEPGTFVNGGLILCALVVWRVLLSCITAPTVSDRKRTTQWGYSIIQMNKTFSLWVPDSILKCPLPASPSALLSHSLPHPSAFGLVPFGLMPPSRSGGRTEC